MTRANLFTISPGAPFLPTFVDALMSGRVIADFPGDDPLALGSATIYTPTRRSARALASAFAARLPKGGATLLPRIVPLGQAEELETALVLDPFVDAHLEAGAGGDLPPPAIEEFERRLTFTRLILAWGRSVERALTPRGPPDPGDAIDEGFRVAARLGHAWILAGDLARLADELIIEDVPWSALDRIAPEEFDGYWGLTLGFLEIAREHWPRILAERGKIEAASRRALLIADATARVVEDRLSGPVIAIGSTGTNRATAALLAAISRSTRGAVVLPGLDKSLDESVWASIADPRGESGTAGHPQAALRRLMSMLGVRRDAVEELGRPDPHLARRATFLSEAMIPAESTERWKSFDASVANDALLGVDLIEAADEREEALALAIRMREILESPDGAAALITPDRSIAARVRAELARWGVQVDDSAGQPLGEAPAGLFARLILRAAASPDLSIDFFTLLQHQDYTAGFARPRVVALTALAEIALARTSAPPGTNLDLRFAGARAAAADRRAFPALAAASAADFDEMEELVRNLARALDGLRNLSVGAPLSAWIAAHRLALRQLETRSDDDEDARARETLFERLNAAAGADSTLFEASDYLDVFESLARELALHETRIAHPRLQILGLLEARLLSVDHVLLAGLEETIWPPAAATDAFLNRAMRADLGLSPPERRLGQTAHDFTQAMGTANVVLSRARKRGGAPTAPSRFLQRMQALAGAAAWSDLLGRGDRWIALAREIERSVPMAPAGPPRPMPALDLRPKRLSVTRIETLRRDPYAIYAEFILRLSPLPPFDAPETARAAGEELHAALAEFVGAHATGALPDDAAHELRALALQRLAPLLDDVEWRAFQWPRLEKAIAAFVDWDDARRDSIARIFVEQKGSLSTPLADGSLFTLTGIADRLEQRTNGAWAIVDYKSGAAPSLKEIACGFAPQLTLEAAMLEKGAFACTETGATASEALYLRLSSGEASVQRTTPIKSEPDAFHRLVVEHFEGMIALLSQFRNEETPYLSRPFPQFASRYGNYDHLARVKEWSSSGVEEEAGA